MESNFSTLMILVILATIFPSQASAQLTLTSDSIDLQDGEISGNYHINSTADNTSVSTALNLENNTIYNLSNPDLSHEAATKAYVDNVSNLNLSQVLSQGNNADGFLIEGYGNPSDGNTDAVADVGYVQNFVSQNNADGDSSSANELQNLSVNSAGINDVISIKSGDSSATYDTITIQDDFEPDTDNQTLSEVLVYSAVANQSINLEGHQLRNVVADDPGDAVNKSYVDDEISQSGSDNQELTVYNNTDGVNDAISIEKGNNVTIEDNYEPNTDNQNLSEVLVEDNDAGSVAIVGLDNSTSAQAAVTYSQLQEYVESNNADGDSDSTNEIQNLTEVLGQGNNADGKLIINYGDPTDSDTNAVADVGYVQDYVSSSGSADADADPGNELQNLSVDNSSTNDVIKINSGDDSATYDSVVIDDDYEANTDSQQLGTNGDNITLDDGGSIKAPYATDADKLDGVQLANINWSDVDIEESHVSASDVGLSNVENIAQSNMAGDQLTWDSTNNEIDLSGSLYGDEDAQDAAASALTGSGATTVTYDDGNNQITVSSTDNYIGDSSSHTAGGNLDLNSNNIALNGGYLSNDGDDEGIEVDNNGDISLSGGELSKVGRIQQIQGEELMIGSGSKANNQSVAIGPGADASGDPYISRGIPYWGNETAIGTDSLAGKRGAVAIGYSSNASKARSTAVGYNSLASGRQAISIGDNAEAKGSSSISLGVGNIAEGSRSTVVGVASQAQGKKSIVIGEQSEVQGSRSIVIGSRAGVDSTEGENAIIIGNGEQGGKDSAATGNNSMALGFAANASALGSIAIGNKTTVSSPNTVRLGENKDVEVPGGSVEIQNGDLEVGHSSGGDIRISGSLTEGASLDLAENMKVKQDQQDKVEVGDVVGIQDGEVSRNTSDAALSMVVSAAPGITLGGKGLNLSEQEKERFENSYRAIAFTGQVPVKVRGEAGEGDYLLPSGENDGTTVAVSEEEVSFDEYRDAIGVVLERFEVPENVNEQTAEKYRELLEDAEGEEYRVYNVAVGVK